MYEGRILVEVIVYEIFNLFWKICIKANFCLYTYSQEMRFWQNKLKCHKTAEKIQFEMKVKYNTHLTLYFHLCILRVLTQLPVFYYSSLILLLFKRVTTSVTALIILKNFQLSYYSNSRLQTQVESCSLQPR